ncbi:hypothetical protein F511_11814 [Dorcoceras hygrometricum]|uniref:Uncharacterized protein n=1 Tax=Dorcoceras hygrometricum TaxID=472368 RepID=A0A2Z7DCK9_9LAMI|nr:hypothetical protein F511_11814 [Dorcoceras hygrometricum]
MRIRPPELETSICDVKYHVSLVGRRDWRRPPSSWPPPSRSRLRRCAAVAPPCRRPVIGLVSITVLRRFRPWQNPSALLVQTDGGLLFPVVDLITRIYRRLPFKCRFPCETGQSEVPRRQKVVSEHRLGSFNTCLPELHRFCTVMRIPPPAWRGDAAHVADSVRHRAACYVSPPYGDPRGDKTAGLSSRCETPSSGCTRSPDEISTNGFSTSSWPETNFPAKTAAAQAAAAAA